MLAYVPLVFAAVVAAFPREDVHTGSIYKRSALAKMDIKQAQSICSKDESLFCCNNSDKCGVIEVGLIKESEFLIDHCKSVVVCCSVENKNTIQVGDAEQCTYAGDLA